MQTSGKAEIGQYNTRINSETEVQVPIEPQVHDPDDVRWDEIDIAIGECGGDVVGRHKRAEGAGPACCGLQPDHRDGLLGLDDGAC